jgi:hypothetical protein
MDNNPDNPELGELVEAVLDVADELTQLRERAFPPKPPIVLSGEADWPWAPGTQVQGFLGSRWNRRDGDAYGGASVNPSRTPRTKQHPRA